MCVHKKRIVFIFGLLLLTVSMAWCALSQGESNQDNNLLFNKGCNSMNGSVREAENVEMILSDAEKCQEPPVSVIFNSIDDYISFTKSVNLSDEEFSLFLSDEYSMNGINDKNTIKEILKWLEVMPFPNSSDYLFKQLIIYPDREEAFILYKNKDDQSCSFLMFLGTEKTMDDYLQAPADNKLIAVDLSTIDNSINRIFYLDEGEVTARSFYIDFGNCISLCRIYGSLDYASSLNVLREFSYSNTYIEATVETTDS